MATTQSGIVQDVADRSRGSFRLICFIAAVLACWALKATAAVTLPLVFAVFLIALVWPIQSWLQTRWTTARAAMVSVCIVLLAVGIFAGAMYLSMKSIATNGNGQAQGLQSALDDLRRQMTSWGLPLSANEVKVEDWLEKAGAKGSLMVTSFLAGAVLTLAFFILGLLEVCSFRRKLVRMTGDQKAQPWLDSVDDIVCDFQRYLGVRTLVGLITGAAVTLLCWLIGLPFALVWGLINFLLNYIPTLGSIVAVIPPFLFALVHYDGMVMPFVALLSVGGVQLLMGNLIDPLLQGRYLALSPLVVLLAVSFGGWIWGIPGAFVGVPIVVAVVIVCDHFDRTRWVSIALAQPRE